MPKQRNKVFVTACGVVSSIGCSVESFTQNMFAGMSGIKNIRGVGEFPKDFPVPYAGVIEDKLDQFKYIPRHIVESITHTGELARSWRCTLLALEQIFEKIKVIESIDAFVYGTPDGTGYEVVEDAYRKKNTGDFDLKLLNGNGCHDFLIESIRSYYGVELAPDKIYSMNAACATGNQAIGISLQRIRAGIWDRVLVSGVDTRCTLANMMNFHMLMALSTADVEPSTASRPFDRTRCGFVRGEAAGILLLESAESQAKTGNPILAEIVGYGNTSDAYRLTDPREDGLCLKKAMENAIIDAGIHKEQIDYINAHGTSTLLNDKIETMAIKELFGDYAYKLAVSSLKSQIGHPTVAAGILESIACVQMLQHQKLAPTINLHNPDPDCDLNYVPLVAQKRKVDYILSNNIGFGGQNICVVLKKA